MRRLLLFLGLFFPALIQGQVLFNELQSSNLETYRDEDGDFEDWIELHNTGLETVDLDGWWLSDDPSNPYQWRFPQVLLPSDSLLMVMASGKDRRLWYPHWETIIDRGHIWSYFEGYEEPPSNWMMPEFDDASWHTGPSGFGSGDGDDASFVNVNVVSCYIRTTFRLEDLSTVEALLLHVDYDDGIIVYLNGVEIARENLGYPGEAVYYDTTCDLEHEAALYRGLWPAFYFFPDPENWLIQGMNTLAIEVHNEDVWNDMSLIPFLTYGMETAPYLPKGLSDDLTHFLPYLHSNFSISSSGEALVLTRFNGALEDQVNIPELSIDHSFGRYPAGQDNWLIYPQPTPAAANDSSGAATVAEAPEVTADSGYYSGELWLWLSSPSPDAEIRYTYDSTEPSDSSRLYTQPIYVNGNKALRARCFEAGKLPSPIISRSYIFDEPSTLPVISLISDPVNIWDEETGFYVLGDEYDPEWPYFGANFWEDWERPFHLDLILPDGSWPWEMDLGLKIHGGYSRAFSQKSLRLIPRGGYGQGSFDYPIFEERELASFDRLILRNSGNEWPGTVLRDALAQRVTEIANLDRQAAQPVRVYMNALYWGIYNVRERLDRFYLRDHHGLDPDNLDLIEFRDEVLEGDATGYLAMLDYIETNGLSDSLHYAHIKSQMDVDNHAAYCIFEIYLGNTDWPGGNIKFWRTREPQSRWRWLLYDLDVGLGYWEDYSYDTFEWATSSTGWGQQNQPWATFLLRSLLENEEYRERFINRYADYLNSALRSESFGEILNEFTTRIDTEIPFHMDRWSQDYQYWLDEVAVVSEFIQERPAQAREHIRNNMVLGEDWELTLSIEPEGAGLIKLEGISVDSLWSGAYFLGNPVRLRAEAAAGYQFAGWSDSLLSDSHVYIDALGDSALSAYFEIDAAARLVINEINYHGPDSGDPGDWIEIYNPTPQKLDLSGWSLSDGDDAHVFILPEESFVESGEYLIFCENRSSFQTFFPDVQNLFGDLGFGFSGNGEAVRFYDEQGRLIDRVVYEDGPPWPPLADGFGATLELIHPYLDNSLAESWASSPILLGSPGARNDAFDPIEVDEELPGKLSFAAPWPNPFNPKVTLSFTLPKLDRARLEIFDLRGRQVDSLFEGILDPGRHEFSWNGAGHASGLYFARLRSGDRVLTRKLLLLK